MTEEETLSLCVVVLGFRRPELLESRLKQLSSFPGIQIHVYIDRDVINGDANNEAFKSIEYRFSDLEITWTYREENLGIADNLLFSVDEVLRDFQSCIVIEDDVSISSRPFQSLMRKLRGPLPLDVLTVGLFSGLPKPVFWRIGGSWNAWRKTPYFSAWGWGVQREMWFQFRNATMNEKWATEGLIAKHWINMKIESRESWEYRFGKLRENPRFTWDYQIQYFSFKNNYVHVLPIFRSADNEGFGDVRSTNTKSERPYWYFGKTYEEFISQEIPSNSKVSGFFTSVDSFTWAGDSKFFKKLVKLKTHFGRFLSRLKQLKAS